MAILFLILYSCEILLLKKRCYPDGLERFLIKRSGKEKGSKITRGSIHRAHKHRHSPIKSPYYKKSRRRASFLTPLSRPTKNRPERRPTGEKENFSPFFLKKSFFSFLARHFLAYYSLQISFLKLLRLFSLRATATRASLWKTSQSQK